MTILSTSSLINIKFSASFVWTTSVCKSACSWCKSFSNGIVAVWPWHVVDKLYFRIRTRSSYSLSTSRLLLTFPSSSSVDFQDYVMSGCDIDLIPRYGHFAPSVTYALHVFWIQTQRSTALTRNLWNDSWYPSITLTSELRLLYMFEGIFTKHNWRHTNTFLFNQLFILSILLFSEGTSKYHMKTLPT